ncbi:hypothetical protein ACQCQT_21915, partial [Ralstonia pseudosolanacearum]|uniref:hypothetical protein n=1 Tax=Ralstonia pseudosolanacearum TaxID=1310165 RepID=UPI003CF8551E
MTVPVPVPPLMRTGRPDPAGPRDSRRCAVAAATVVLVGAAPLAAHAARPSAGSQDDAAARNLRIEMRRNAERYRFLRWASNT